MSKPFGLMQYVGAWLTQLFHYPALGSAVLAAIWILIFYVGTKALRLQGKASGRRFSVNNASALMILAIGSMSPPLKAIGSRSR